jgi:thiol-disulfide isomerase/thioredoxin
MKLVDYPLIVMVWGMDGCPACEEYIPRFRRVASKYAQCVPAVVLDANRYEDAANHFRIRATPTTITSRYGRRGIYAIEGDAPDEDIEKLFTAVMWGRDCKL